MEPIQIQNSPEAPELTILMPCLNEEANLPDAIRSARKFLTDNQVLGEILIVDNGSTDRSAEIARSLDARVISVPERGYGNALRAGIRQAQGIYTIMGDCDTTYDFEHLLPFLAELRSGHAFLSPLYRSSGPFLYRTHPLSPGHPRFSLWTARLPYGSCTAAAPSYQWYGVCNGIDCLLCSTWCFHSPGSHYPFCQQPSPQIPPALYPRRTTTSAFYVSVMIFNRPRI